MPTFRNGIDTVCPRCRSPLRATAPPGAEKPPLLELLRELKAPKAESQPERAERIRKRALEAIAFRVKVLGAEEARSGHAVIGPLSWGRLKAARAWLAKIDEAIEAGADPPENEK